MSKSRVTATAKDVVLIASVAAVATMTTIAAGKAAEAVRIEARKWYVKKRDTQKPASDKSS